jgi:hypothetical protein
MASDLLTASAADGAEKRSDLDLIGITGGELGYHSMMMRCATSSAILFD